MDITGFSTDGTIHMNNIKILIRLKRSELVGKSHPQNY